MADHAKKSTDKTTGAVRVRRAVVRAPKIPTGVVQLDADDFAQLEECMTQPRGPNQAMISAMDLHRSLTSRR
jgi:hypothetical protein